MTTLQYKILKYMLYKPHTIDQTLAHLNRFRLRKVKRPTVVRAIDTLEDQFMVEELGIKEKALLEVTGEETTGETSDWSGFYLATEDNGVEIGEDMQEENRRFYMPFICSAIFTTLSIVISLVALFVSLA